MLATGELALAEADVEGGGGEGAVLLHHHEDVDAPAVEVKEVAHAAPHVALSHPNKPKIIRLPEISATDEREVGGEEGGLEGAVLRPPACGRGDSDAGREVAPPAADGGGGPVRGGRRARVPCLDRPPARQGKPDGRTAVGTNKR
jgi:hypothetical protein